MIGLRWRGPTRIDGWPAVEVAWEGRWRRVRVRYPDSPTGLCEGRWRRALGRQAAIWVAGRVAARHVRRRLRMEEKLRRQLAAGGGRR